MMRKPRRVMPRDRQRASCWLFEIRIGFLSGPRRLLGATGRTVVPVQAYDSRMSKSRRPSVFSSFFTALEAITSPWLA